MACQKVYRDTTLGKLLQETLDELTEEDDRMTPDLAMEALAEFDSSMKKALANHTKNRNKVVYNFKAGDLNDYRLCDNVWTISLSDVKFDLKDGQGLIEVDKVKIVAADVNATPPTNGP